MKTNDRAFPREPAPKSQIEIQREHMASLKLTERAFEMMQMLQLCRDHSYKLCEKDTVLSDIKPDSFQFVMNETIDLIIKLCGGIG